MEETKPCRSVALQFDCPYCDAVAGDPCKGIRRPIRLAMHRERHRVALNHFYATRGTIGGKDN